MVQRRFILSILISLIFLVTVVKCDECSKKGDCKIVPYYLCKNTTDGIQVIITDGSTVFQPRNTNFNVCCCKICQGTPTNECGKRNAPIFDPRIVGGPTTRIGEFPWMIALFKMPCSTCTRGDEGVKTLDYLCGGTLIHSGMVLTTAHSVISFKNHSSLLIARAGEWDIQNTNEEYPHQDRDVTEIIIHPSFNPSNLWNDFAILKLKEPFILGYHINLICLPPSGFVNRGGCLVTGWGKERYVDYNYKPSALKKVDLEIVNKNDCTSRFRQTRAGPDFILDDSFICAGGIKGVDACSGDGGSPLVCPYNGSANTYVLMGLVSWGLDCGEAIPGVYANVGYVDLWIKEITMQMG